MSEYAYGLPVIVSDLADNSAHRLTRIRFENKVEKGYTERWIQELISKHPSILPIDQIEPALTPVIPICMELPVASGFVDNFYATPDGDLIIGETKLFRNWEARREVIAQIIDYAKDLSILSYADLDEAIRKAESADGKGGHPAMNLYTAVTTAVPHQEILEEQFVDAVSRNLRRGRFLLLIIGDGIQEGTEKLTAFLQQHAGMHFTLGLVELAIFEMPGSERYLIQPRVVARTKNIERAIVTIEDGKITAKSAAVKGTGSTTLSEEKFYEQLSNTYPLAVPQLKAFVSELESIGIVKDLGKGSLILRWRPNEKLEWNLGSITTSGKVWTDFLNFQTDAVGLLNLSHRYLEQLAAAVGGYIKKPSKPTSWYVAKDGTYVTIDALLSHQEKWRAAIQQFIDDATEAMKARDE